MADRYEVKREFQGKKVVVTAERIERIEMYLLVTKVDGEVFDADFSEDVWADIQTALAQPFVEDDQLVNIAVDEKAPV